MPTTWSTEGRRWAVNSVAGFGAGCFAVLCSNPVDVVRTRLQVDRSARASIVGTYKRLIAEEGYAGLWKGVSARCMSFGPVSVLILGNVLLLSLHVLTLIIVVVSLQAFMTW
jgi:hypothetical protein